MQTKQDRYTSGESGESIRVFSCSTSASTTENAEILNFLLKLVSTTASAEMT